MRFRFALWCFALAYCGAACQSLKANEVVSYNLPNVAQHWIYHATCRNNTPYKLRIIRFYDRISPFTAHFTSETTEILSGQTVSLPSSVFDSNPNLTMSDVTYQFLTATNAPVPGMPSGTLVSWNLQAMLSSAPAKTGLLPSIDVYDDFDFTSHISQETGLPVVDHIGFSQYYVQGITFAPIPLTVDPNLPSGGSTTNFPVANSTAAESSTVTNISVSGGVTTTNIVTTSGSVTSSQDSRDKQDIYTAVKSALNDSGSSGLQGMDNHDIKYNTDLIDINSRNSAITSTIDGITTKTLPTMALPTSLGQTWSVSLPMGYHGLTVQVDLTQYSAPINVFRYICLFAIAIATWFVWIRILRSGVA